jgi:hypothetical protein
VKHKKTSASQNQKQNHKKRVMMVKRFCSFEADACELVVMAQMHTHAQNTSCLLTMLNMQNLNPKSFTWILHSPNKIHRLYKCYFNFFI